MSTVALVPAFMAEETIAETVRALSSFVDEVLVVDDGSTDATAAQAAAAGASVERLTRNRGKAAAVRVGIEARSSASIYLMADSDLGATASGLRPLLGPVVSGATDMTIGVLPGAGKKGGFGLAKGLAGWGIRRATGWEATAPLSGQRAVKGALLRALFRQDEPASRFGLEVALTIEALRARARVTEMAVEVDHRHRGRRAAGFAHRGRQAGDIAQALWPRLTSRLLRCGLMVVAFVLSVGLLHLAAGRGGPVATALAPSPGPVVMVGMPGVAISDLESMPNLSRLAREGALGAMTVRTRTGFPSTVEGYATLGAGARVDALTPAAQAFNAGEPLEGGSAAESLSRRSGRSADGRVVVVGWPAALRQAGDQLPSLPGSLGDALAAAGKQTAVVGNADVSKPRIIEDPQLGPLDPEEPAVLPDVSRPVAAALADSGGNVDFGLVDSGLLAGDASAPYGLRADPVRVLAAVQASLEAGADVVLVDPGDLDRAAQFAELASPQASAAQRRTALGAVDALLPELRTAAGPRFTLMVFGITPPAKEWRLTPVVLHGPGIEPGRALDSSSTRRPGVATLTDLAPTVLHLTGVPADPEMIGSALRTASSSGSDALLAELVETDAVADHRESIYLGSTMAYIGFQAALYVLALFVFIRLGTGGRAASLLRLGVLAVAAHPLGTFLYRAIPGVEDIGPAAALLLPVIDVVLAAAALRLGRRDAVLPLGWISAATVVVLALDAASGERLQLSSLLGYSFHSAGRFTGFGNQAFAVLAATTILAVAIHVHRAPRKKEALLAAGLVFAFVVVLDGSPSLGSDVGGILTLVPVFGLTLFALTGRRISRRAVALAVVATAVCMSLAIGADLARPPADRTHLGRLAAQVVDGGAEPLLETIGRKAATNLRTWGSPWVWGLAVLAISLITVLAVDRGWLRIVPRGSALRAGLVGTLAAGIVGYAVNDSGVVVAALVFVYLGPFLTLQALDVRNDGSVAEVAG
jgi:hypothetical protein